MESLVLYVVRSIDDGQQAAFLAWPSADIRKHI